MDRQSRRAVLVVLLGVVALGAVAAGIPLATPEAGDGEAGAGASDRATPSLPAGDPTAVTVPPVFGVAVLLAGAGAVLWILLREGSPARVVAPVLAVALVAGLLAVLDLSGGAGAIPGAELGRGLPAPGAGSEGGEGGGVAVPPALLLAATLGALAIPAALYVVRRESGGEADGDDPGDDGGAAIARAAGRTADRIETGDRPLDNEVYRCWRAMADHVDPATPAARTPGEFERAAVDRGIDPDDARELTALFERVRYGDRPPTDGAERRAVELLRRIEGAYGEGDEG